MVQLVMQTDLDLPNKRSGKVRDLYDVLLPDGDPGLLIVATDRTSAFDVVMANGLPGKGIVLTQISQFWFDYFGDRIDHHLVSTAVEDVGDISEEEMALLSGRIMLCQASRRPGVS